MTIEVSFQVFPIRECPGANVTLERLQTRVSAHVSAQVIRVLEHLSARAAFVRFLAGVRSDVNGEAILSSKRRRA